VREGHLGAVADVSARVLDVDDQRVDLRATGDPEEFVHPSGRAGGPRVRVEGPHGARARKALAADPPRALFDLGFGARLVVRGGLGVDRAGRRV
jgi:hypothetical protein